MITWKTILNGCITYHSNSIFWNLTDGNTHINPKRYTVYNSKGLEIMSKKMSKKKLFI